ncbi:hypothetical protein HYX07_04335 [Candidatus Woesearchaeota archaeon]|nr:hypothetical protein [Candidatus Woesearchaeota archaeon]
MLEEITKPTGRLRDLYDRVALYGSTDPRSEIERLARSALTDGLIDKKRYVILEHRTPFQGVERETLEAVGRRVHVNRRRAQELESETSGKLNGYVSIGQAYGEFKKMRVVDLPWKPNATHARARIALTSVKPGATVEDVADFFHNLERQGKPIRIRGYGASAHQAAYEVFAKVGKNLPQIGVQVS